ncbi:GNAT family N-acetyltransferase [Desulfospira joergensenii]|uniref:GNAT family N-acetyltransferase n=1 Tax=Desulfospira joergensenii TaxID=53329 RepID=UPI0003B38855|nr:GNAT family N-acetyltransferase [Desulfospira joergensenii]
MKETSLEIRNATPDDIPFLVNLLEQLFSIEEDFLFDADLQARGLALMLDGCGKHRTILAACDRGRVIGMVSVQTRISTARGKICGIMEDLVVDLEHRGKGVGKNLINAAYSWSREHGIEHLWLLADKDNRPALQFYTDRKWDSTNLICMTKTIGNE